MAKKTSKFVSLLVLVFFLTSTIMPPSLSAQGVGLSGALPAPGTLVMPTQAFDPVQLMGMQIDLARPFQVNFILDTGDTGLMGDPLKDEVTRIARYFLASLALPEKDLWVNLSPYEKERIIPEDFGLTEMGRDVLAQDYVLKQLTSSLLHPDHATGKDFWQRIRERAAREFGASNISVETLHKIWIVPEKAEVFVNGSTALLGEVRLKVLLEEDYWAQSERASSSLAAPEGGSGLNALQTQILRDVVVPEVAREVNEGELFATLRQVYRAMVLAVWYKNTLTESMLIQRYADSGRIDGVDLDDPAEKEKIYAEYLAAFKKGVFNFIREDTEPLTQQVIPRKYFSGGVDNAMIAQAIQVKEGPIPLEKRNGIFGRIGRAGAGVVLAALALTASGTVHSAEAPSRGVIEITAGSPEQGLISKEAFRKILEKRGAFWFDDVRLVLNNENLSPAMIRPYWDMFLKMTSNLKGMTNDERAGIVSVLHDSFRLFGYTGAIERSGGQLIPFSEQVFGRFFQTSSSDGLTTLYRLDEIDPPTRVAYVKWASWAVQQRRPAGVSVPADVAEVLVSFRGFYGLKKDLGPKPFQAFFNQVIAEHPIIALKGLLQVKAGSPDWLEYWPPMMSALGKTMRQMPFQDVRAVNDAVVKMISDAGGYQQARRLLGKRWVDFMRKFVVASADSLTSSRALLDIERETSFNYLRALSSVVPSDHEDWELVMNDVFTHAAALLGQAQGSGRTDQRRHASAMVYAGMLLGGYDGMEEFLAKQGVFMRGPLLEFLVAELDKEVQIALNQGASLGVVNERLSPNMNALIRMLFWYRSLDTDDGEAYARVMIAKLRRLIGYSGTAEQLLARLDAKILMAHLADFANGAIHLDHVIRVLDHPLFRQETADMDPAHRFVVARMIEVTLERVDAQMTDENIGILAPLVIQSWYEFEGRPILTEGQTVVLVYGDDKKTFGDDLFTIRELAKDFHLRLIELGPEKDKSEVERVLRDSRVSAAVFIGHGNQYRDNRGIPHTVFVRRSTSPSLGVSRDIGGQEIITDEEAGAWIKGKSLLVTTSCYGADFFRYVSGAVVVGDAGRGNVAIGRSHVLKLFLEGDKQGGKIRGGALYNFADAPEASFPFISIPEKRGTVEGIFKRLKFKPGKSKKSIEPPTNLYGVVPIINDAGDSSRMYAGRSSSGNRDTAMIASASTASPGNDPVGGIDLNPVNMDLIINGTLAFPEVYLGESVRLPDDFSGLTPQVLFMVPVVSGTPAQNP